MVIDRPDTDIHLIVLIGTLSETVLHNKNILGSSRYSRIDAIKVAEVIPVLINLNTNLMSKKSQKKDVKKDELVVACRFSVRANRIRS